MKVVIISGGIGSGKSTVCRMLRDTYGWPVYEADNKVKALYREHPSLLSDIETALGESFRNDDGCFEPSVLASRIFKDPEALSEVERLVFPVLISDFKTWKSSFEDKDYVVLESATILEKPSLVELGDIVVVVDAPYDTRIQRAVRRDISKQDAVEVRASNQKLMNSISAGNIPDVVDYVIFNDGSFADLQSKVSDFVGNRLVTKML